MTRTHRPTNPLGVAVTVAATIFAAVVILLWSYPELFWVVVGIFGVCAVAVSLLFGFEERAARKKSDAELAIAKRLVLRLDAENTQLHGELTEAQVAAGVVVPLPGPRLRAIPTQREASDYDWPLYDEKG